MHQLACAPPPLPADLLCPSRPLLSALSLRLASSLCPSRRMSMLERSRLVSSSNGIAIIRLSYVVGNVENNQPVLFVLGRSSTRTSTSAGERIASGMILMSALQTLRQSGI